MIATAQALDSIEPMLLSRGWRMDDVRQQSLRRLMRYLKRMTAKA